jgi:hypothetical protein
VFFDHTKTKKAILLLILILPGAIFAQDKAASKPDALTLSDQEKAQWRQFGESEKQLSQAYDQAIAGAVNQPVGEASKEIHAAIQRAWLALNLVKAQREAWLNKLLLERDCKGCGIEGDKLIRPK